MARPASLRNRVPAERLAKRRRESGVFAAALAADYPVSRLDNDRSQTTRGTRESANRCVPPAAARRSAQPVVVVPVIGTPFTHWEGLAAHHMPAFAPDPEPDPILDPVDELEDVLEVAPALLG